MNRTWATLVSLLVVGCGMARSERSARVEPAAMATHDARYDDQSDAPPATAPFLFEPEGVRHVAARFEWRVLGGAHWQIVSDVAEDPRATDAREGTRGACPAGMVQVSGQMKVDAHFDDALRDTCAEWINRGAPERCGQYDGARWRAIVEAMPVKPMGFCIDRFEYPNLAGQYPAVHADYREAAALCSEQGKRLCDEEEWTFACEGEEATPYPNGYGRDAEACAIDAPWQEHDERLFSPERGAVAAEEMDRLWSGRRSGDSPACRSSFGVHDMTGNVDEWTTSVSGTAGGRSILKGGYWGPVRARCRPSTRAHGEHHKYYQQGFRCCSGVSQA